VLECQPFGGPLSVSFVDGPARAIGGQLAGAMRVELDGGRPPRADVSPPAGKGSPAGEASMDDGGAPA
jgi:hypothetical protein